MEHIKVTLSDEELSQINGGIDIWKEVTLNGQQYTMTLGTLNRVCPHGKDEPGGNDPWFVK